MSTEHSTILEVEGMTCGNCVRHVNEALTELEGVGRVDVRLADKIVVVEHDAARAPLATLIHALDEAGYPARPRPA